MGFAGYLQLFSLILRGFKKSGMDGQTDGRTDSIWRFKDASKNISFHCLVQERALSNKAGHFSDSTQPDFVRPIVNEAYKSAEERIKRNIKSVQRSKADQDKNFTKR